jgi:hypothetical protein
MLMIGFHLVKHSWSPIGRQEEVLSHKTETPRKVKSFSPFHISFFFFKIDKAYIRWADRKTRLNTQFAWYGLFLIGVY